MSMEPENECDAYWARHGDKDAQRRMKEPLVPPIPQRPSDAATIARLERENAALRQALAVMRPLLPAWLPDTEGGRRRLAMVERALALGNPAGPLANGQEHEGR